MLVQVVRSDWSCARIDSGVQGIDLHLGLGAGGGAAKFLDIEFSFENHIYALRINK